MKQIVLLLITLASPIVLAAQTTVREASKGTQAAEDSHFVRPERTWQEQPNQAELSGQTATQPSISKPDGKQGLRDFLIHRPVKKLKAAMRTSVANGMSDNGHSLLYVLLVIILVLIILNLIVQLLPFYFTGLLVLLILILLLLWLLGYL